MSMVRRSTGSCSLPSTSRDDLRLADGQLVALAAHLLDEDRQRQLAAALHLPGVGALGGQDPHRDVADELAVEAVLDQARGDLRAAHPPASGEVLVPIVIEIAGSSTVISGSGRGSSRSARVSPIMMSGMPAMAMMSPGAGGLAGRRLALQALGHEQLGDLTF
jgi:hypothetical protein